MRRLILAVAVAGLAACGGVSEPISGTTAPPTTRPGEPPVSTTSRPTQTAPLATTAPGSTTTTPPPATTTTTGTFAGADYIQFGDGIVQVRGGVATQLVSDPVMGAWDDGRGGVVFQILGPERYEHYWLPAGNDDPIDLSVHILSFVGVIEDQPRLIHIEFAPDDCTAPDWYHGEGYFATDLVTGEERFLFCDAGGPDGGDSFRSLGGELFVGVTWEAWDAGGTNKALVFQDLAGRAVDITHNPFPGYPSSCAPCELDAYLSPDGSLLAYRYRPDAPWPPERLHELTWEGWQEETGEVRGEITVIQLDTGNPVFATTVDAATTLTDFDGRFLALTHALEPWGEPAATSIVDMSGGVATVEVPGRVSLIK